MATEIKDIKTSIMGTIEFNLKCSGHRGFQEFLFYPAETRSNKIKIQSDNRIGFYYPDNGEIVLSKSRSSGSYAHHLILDKLTHDFLSEADRLKLNQALRGTSENTGNYAVRICNQYAAEAR
jgi:hypothetical protein